MSRVYVQQDAPPPSFEEAKNTRQKVRAAGMHPDYWYPAAWAKDLKPGEVKEVVFWKRSIALFRGDDGQVRAIDNRCAHRQLKLTTGHVEGCNLVCPYHGWAYDGQGRVVDIPHSLFGRKFPKFQVPSIPVKVKHGLIFIFPGDPEKSEDVAPPDIPELQGQNPWPTVCVDSTWKAHHSMIMDNVSDFTHAFLHRRFKPFDDAKLIHYETIGDTVELEYETKVGRGPISGLFVDRSRVDSDSMKLGYEYPYQRSNTDNQIKHWCFVRPIDERTTASFFIFYFRSFRVPFTKVPLPFNVMRGLLAIGKKLTVQPLLEEDGVAVECEQDGYDRHWDAPLAELNPVVKSFQELTIRKWEEYLASQTLTTISKKSKDEEARV